MGGRKASRAARVPHQIGRDVDPTADIETLFREYKRTGSERIRNFLIERYLDVVRHTAERMHMRLPTDVDVEDLKSAGLFGLMDAIDAFDVDRGVRFETYCAQRIRGAIFDELRAMDWLPRLIRSRTAKVERARQGLEMELGRRPTEKEIADRLELSKAERNRWYKDSKPIGISSLNRKWIEPDSKTNKGDFNAIRDAQQENPFDEVQRKDFVALITKGFSRAERLIMILFYYEEMTMKEIGLALDLSESRVSLMHSAILSRLKARYQNDPRLRVFGIEEETDEDNGVQLELSLIKATDSLTEAATIANRATLRMMNCENIATAIAERLEVGGGHGNG